MEHELFEIKLDDSAKARLNTLFVWARLFYLCAVITCLADLIMGYLGFRITTIYNRVNHITYNSTHYLEVPLFILYGCFALMQAFFLFKFSILARKHMATGDSFQFNQSLKWLVQHTKTAALFFLINSIWIIIQLINTLKFYNRARHLG